LPSERCGPPQPINQGLREHLAKPLVLFVRVPDEEGALSGLTWTRSLTLRASTILLRGYKLTSSPERFTLRHNSPLLGGVLVRSAKKEPGSPRRRHAAAKSSDCRMSSGSSPSTTVTTSGAALSQR